MPTFERCDDEINAMATGLLREFESHKPLIDGRVRIDFLFAFCERDANGQPKNDALKLHGCKALGITKKSSPKDKAKGLGDAEILLDGDWWQEATEPQRRALLDHELHHLAWLGEKDETGRPILDIRHHDVDVGWFKIIAERHGAASLEQIQAAQMMESSGQYFWPSIRNVVAGPKASRVKNLELVGK